MEAVKNIAFLPLLIASILAFFAPIISRRIRKAHIPPIVVTIILGIIFGPHALGLLDVEAAGSEFLLFIADLGFIFLMFLAGLEIDFERLLGLRKNIDLSIKGIFHSPIILAFVIFLGPLVLSIGAALLLKDYGYFKNFLLFGLLLSTISVGVVVPTLKERNEIDSSFGQTIVVGALLADFGTLILFSALVMLHEGRSALGLSVYFILVGAFLLLYLLGREILSKGPIRKIFEELAHAATQIRVRGSLALMLALVAVSEAIGVDGILGAFLAGAVISLLLGHEREQLIAKLDIIGYGFFIPLFFIVIGAEFDLRSFVSSFDVITLVILLVGIGAVVKIIPSLVLWPKFGFRNAMAGGVLISARLSLCIAVSHIAFKLDLISASLNSAIIIMAAVSSTLAPVFYAKIKKATKLEGGKVIIAGAGKHGGPFIQRLNMHHIPMTIIEKVKEKFDEFSRIDAKFVVGDCSSEEVLRLTDPHPTDTYVALTDSDYVNRESCLKMKDRFSVTKLIARDNDPKNTEQFRSLGIIPLNLTLHGAIALENLIFRPALYKAVAVEDQRGKEFFEIELRNQKLEGVEIKKFPYRGDFLIVAIRREEELLIPHGDTKLQLGDTVMFLASPEEKTKIEKLFNPDRITIPYFHDYFPEE
ncbi:monovalent cation:proton antiporter family protein [Bdellovibrionota bacterium]